MSDDLERLPSAISPAAPSAISPAAPLAITPIRCARRTTELSFGLALERFLQLAGDLIGRGVNGSVSDRGGRADLSGDPMSG